MNWYFIRHGEIASNRKKVYSGRSDEPLTIKGIEQAREAGCKLAEQLDLDAIFCSPLARTRQTVEIIVKELKRDIPVHVDECFNELKMGPWEGLSESEAERQFPVEWAIWNSKPADLSIEGRETLAQLQSRVIEGIRSIERSHDYASVLVMTHVAIIRVVSLFDSGWDLNEYKSVQVENAKIFNFELSDLRG